ncbi:MAG TPA: SMP-30/gluconolactonase/LRE family protein [Vicinamibacterales bacterium]|nr:SMP-30/gluconolactonase/LRE family protein [Vicinamibacterales bacterium]
MKLMVSFLALTAGLLAAGDLPPQTAVKPVKIAEVPGYCEGIVFDRSGIAYVSDTQHGTIYTIAPDGKTALWARTPAPNGHKILSDGTHLVCDKGAVLHLDATGKKLADASSECEGKPLRAPNDLTIDPKGGFYFTDPGGSDVKNPIGTVHYVDPQGKTHLIAQGLAFPNGIILRPDGKTLLVGESGHNRILSFPVVSPGKLAPRTVFATLPTKQGDQIENAPDGMTLDEDGNLFVAHYGMHTVQVLGPDGKLLRSYPGGNLTTSNVAFWGPNMDQLFITGALADEKTSKGAVWRLDLKGVRGLKLLR